MFTKLPVHAAACGVGEFIVIHPPVSFGRHLVKDIAGLGISMGTTVAVAHGGLAVIERRGRKGGAASLKPLVECVNRIGHGDEHELVAAYAVDMLIGMAVQLKAAGNLGDIAIARRVPKAVVADFKAVDIDIGDCVLELAVPDTCEIIGIGGAVGQPRERVGVSVGSEFCNALA